MNQGRSSSRRRGRRQRTDTPQQSALNQLPWQQLRYLDQPTEPLSEEGLEHVHDAAMRILEEVGIDFLNEEARSILKSAGCDLEPDSDRVRMDRGFVMEQIALAPSRFNITPRNPDRSIVIGGDAAAFGSVASPPNTTDLDQGRRVGNRQDFQNLLG